MKPQTIASTTSPSFVLSQTPRPRTAEQGAAPANTPALPRRAPLENVAPGVMRIVGRYLSVTDSTRLAWASGAMSRTMRQLERREAGEMARSLGSLMQPVERPVAPARRGFNLSRLFAKVAPARTGKIDAAHGIDASAADRVVFDFAFQRLYGSPREGQGPYGELHRAINEGKVDLVRAGLREFLSLPEHVLPASTKFEWLREAKGMCSLEFFSQYRCGDLSTLEMARCESIAAYVNEIVSSEQFDLTQKRDLCVCLQLSRNRGGPKTSIISLPPGAHAMVHNNPAVAAFILLGIQESSADSTVRSALIATTVSSWRAHAVALTMASKLRKEVAVLADTIAESRRIDKMSGMNTIAECVDMVIASLEPHRHKAPSWVNSTIQRLEAIKTTFPAPACTKV